MTLLVASCLAAAGCAADPRASAAGRLDPAFFGAAVAPRETPRVDYLWVKDGFAIDGRTLHVAAWPAPTWPGGSAPSAEDRRLARRIAAEMPELLYDTVRDEWRGLATASMRSGDVRVVGRVVDCAAGSPTAKLLLGLGAGAGSVTVDVGLVETRTGEPLVALRHRVVSPTIWSSPRGKLADWLEELAEDVDDQGFDRLYAEGTPVGR